MKRIILAVNFHVKRLLFEKFAFPQVKNEHISKAVLKKYLPKNPVIIDCGAHDGSDTIQLAKVFKGSQIHAFEPLEPLFRKLSAQVAKYKNIVCYQLALADNDGLRNFFIS